MSSVCPSGVCLCGVSSILKFEGMHTDRIITRHYMIEQCSTMQYKTVHDITRQYKPVQCSTRVIIEADEPVP